MDALSMFQRLPLGERWFVRGRLATAPLVELASRAPSGLLADIGCGHGVLSALLAEGRPDRRIVAVDPDARKVRWATTALSSQTNIEVRQGDAETLVTERAGPFDAVLVADVLYLFAIEGWGRFLRTCRRLLKPGGLLLLKEAEGNHSWKHYKCLAQELVMVKLLRRTHGSGGLSLMPRAFTEQLLCESGYRVRSIENVSKGYSTPHVLFTAEAA